MSDQVFAFKVSVKGTDWTKIINARTAGKAKYQYWLDVTDCWPDVPITAMRARKYNAGRPYTSPEFERNAKYRGMPEIKCGQRVKVGNSLGIIVGHNSSANFDVLFDDDAPKYGGQTLNVHPQEIELID
jgi:hypothetical protein